MHANLEREQENPGGAATSREQFAAHYAALKPAFDDAGCVVIRQFLPPDELAELRGHLERFARDVAPTLSDGSVIRVQDGALRALENLPVDAYFQRYASSPRWMGLASALLGAPVAPAVPDEFNGSFGGQVFVDMPPGAGTSTPPHQDGRYHNLLPPETVNIWLSLDGADGDNGGMRYVRGSHRRGLRTHGTRGQQPGFSMAIPDFGDEDVAQEVVFALQPGDAVAHHGLTIHRTIVNQTDRHRRAFCMFMRRADCQRDEAGHAWYMDILDAHFAHFNLKPSTP